MSRWRIRCAAGSATPLAAAAAQAGIAVKRGGTYLVMEGPQFSTLAESELYRSWGCDVIGMTNMPEAKLAREAEICYATVAMVTDYDCWHPGHDRGHGRDDPVDAARQRRPTRGPWCERSCRCWRATRGPARRAATMRSNTR